MARSFETLTERFGAVDSGQPKRHREVDAWATEAPIKMWTRGVPVED